MDIGSLTGQVSIEDQTATAFNTVMNRVQHFAEDFDGALGATAISLGIVGAGVLAVGAAVAALGSRGADVNDVSATLDHFAGSAQNARAIMEGLRKGTMDTVDDFELMRQSSRLLSAGVQLTAKDFGTLGEAAFVLQNRGLGSTKEMLDLVSDAMVTGRTRSLAMKLGVIDLGDSEENYAKTLGVTKDMLSEAGKAEAHRISVMSLLNSATKDAGVQQRDFGEQIEFAMTKVKNWVDQLSQAVASSPQLSHAVDVIGTSLSTAFGGSSDAAITTITNGIASFLDGVAAVTPLVVELAKQTYKLATAFKDATVDAISFFTTALKEARAFVTYINDHTKIVSVFTEGLRMHHESLERARIDAANLVVEQQLLANASKLAGHEIKDHGEAVKVMQQHISDATTRTFIATEATKENAAATAKSNAAMIDKTAAEKKAAEAAEAHKKKIDAQIDSIHGGIAQVNDFREAITKLGGVQKVVAGLGEQIDIMAWIKKLPQDFRDVERPIEHFQQFYNNMLVSIQQNSVIKPPEIEGGVNAWIQSLEPMGMEAGETLGHSLKNALQGSLSGLPQLMKDAFTGGGGLMGALKALAVDLGQVFAINLGNSIKSNLASGGSIVNTRNLALAGIGGAAAGIGTMAAGGSAKQAAGSVVSTAVGIGMSAAQMGASTAGAVALGAATAGIGLAAVGAYWGLKKLFGATEESKSVNDPRQKYIDQAGGLKSLGEQAVKATGSLILVQNVLGAKTSKAYQTAITELDTALRKFADSPQGMAESMYQTKDQLQAVADKAKSVYEYMRDSGKYSASEIAKAFEAMKDSQIDSMTDAQKAQKNSLDQIIKGYSASIDKLETEYKGLAEGVAAEAQEAEAGVIETRDRARMLDIEKEKAAQIEKRNEAQKLYDDLVAGAQVAYDDIAQVFSKAIHQQIIFDIPTLPEPPDGSNAAGMAMGGIVHAAMGWPTTFTPRGTDTVPIIATPGERILSVAQNNDYEAWQGNRTRQTRKKISPVVNINLPGSYQGDRENLKKDIAKAALEGIARYYKNEFDNLVDQ